MTQSAVLFLIAGFDTTALSLSMVAYHLATNPEAQERARQEADDVAASLGEDGRISYDDVKRWVQSSSPKSGGRQAFGRTLFFFFTPDQDGIPGDGGERVHATDSHRSRHRAGLQQGVQAPLRDRHRQGCQVRNYYEANSYR